ncbi:hypothetical protein CFAEC_08785 [Corynebacterium faecale]|nr:hypothetical protein CFAEC_08785 [Corynebacterium faecale]
MPAHITSLECMIIAVEGPSAAGKTTFCRGLDQTFVAEYQATGKEPEGEGMQVQAHYWTNVNTTRWNSARSLESETGLAYCDSDPMKLHYSWSLARIGEDSIERFEFECTLVREAIVEKRIGFVDAVLVDFPSLDTLTRQKDNDATRNRKSFDLHARLTDPLREWYDALEKADPGRVHPWDVDLDALRPRQRRYDATLLDALLANLPSL